MSWVAIIGPNPKPNKAKPLCCNPCNAHDEKVLLQLLLLQSLTDESHLQTRPLTLGLRLSSVRPMAAPENPDAKEKTIKDRIKILR